MFATLRVSGSVYVNRASGFRLVWRQIRAVLGFFGRSTPDF